MLLIPAIDDELVCRILHNTWPAVDLSFLEFFERTLRLLSRDHFAISSVSCVRRALYMTQPLPAQVVLIGLE
jgi:hypothetical protein